MTPGVPRYAKPDTNQKKIVKDLRALGFDVDIMPLPNKYDIVVSGTRYLIAGGYIECSVRCETKRPGEKLRDNQQEWLDDQRHPDAYVPIEEVNDVLRWFNWRIVDETT